MLVYIPYMDPMGIYGTPICIGYPHLCHQTSPTVPKKSTIESSVSLPAARHV